MIRLIAPQFFTVDIQATLAYYKDKLGFDSRTRFTPNMPAAAWNSPGRLPTPWGAREFVLKDCDGRLLAFGANLE